MNRQENFQRNYQFFLFLDIFGINYNFLLNGKDKQRTFTGAWLTIIYYMIVVGLFLGFGIDLYQRKNPRVLLNTESQPFSLVKLSNSNFTYAYRIEDQTGNIFLDESIVTTKIFYQLFEMKEGN